MGTFVASDVISRIEWDFSDTEKQGFEVVGEHAKGVLPEPSPERAAAFLEAYERFIEENTRAARESYFRERELDRRAAGHVDDETDGDVPDVISAADLYALACVIGREALIGVGVPEDLVEQLPPRFVLAFLRHINKELSGEGDAASSTSS